MTVLREIGRVKSNATIKVTTFSKKERWSIKKWWPIMLASVRQHNYKLLLLWFILDSQCPWGAPACEGARNTFLWMHLPVTLPSFFSFLPLSSQVPVMLLFWVTPVRSLETILAQPLWRNSSVNSIDPPGDHQIHLHRYQLSQTIYKARQDRISQPLRIPIWF